MEMQWSQAETCDLEDFKCGQVHVILIIVFESNLPASNFSIQENISQEQAQ